MPRLYRTMSPRDVYASAMGAELEAPRFDAPTEPPPPRARLKPSAGIFGYDPERAKADHKRRHG